MNLIHPAYSALTGQTAIPINSTNFPCLKHFWDCHETSGHTLTDIVNGVVLTDSGGMTFTTDASGVRAPVPNTAAGAGTITGAIQSPVAKNALILAVGNFNGGAFGLGTTGTTGMIQFASGAGLLRDLPNSISLPASGTAFTSSAGIWGRAMAFTWGNASGLVQVESSTTTAITQKSATSLATAASWSFDTSSGMFWQCPSTVTAFYGAALFIFAGAVPSDYLAAIAWMTKQWSAGNKVIYPGWAGIA